MPIWPPSGGATFSHAPLAIFNLVSPLLIIALAFADRQLHIRPSVFDALVIGDCLHTQMPGRPVGLTPHNDRQCPQCLWHKSPLPLRRVLASARLAHHAWEDADDPCTSPRLG